ncbi:MAG TPA: DNA topoisomerase IB, partial [Acidimicrobiia bacterium]|nr:DNA topoisomerase IB [Acidimicrobiia bacterium]
KSHLKIDGNDLVFEYVGKSSIDQRRVVADTPLVEVIREIMEIPGDRLFQYRTDDGVVHKVTSREVNSYLQEILGVAYTSKDIRTWGGTVRAATILADIGPAKTKKEADKHIVLACKLVSTELGNTPAVCRSAYIHPAVLARYREGKTIEPVMRKTPRPVEAKSPIAYYPEEAALLRLLTQGP